MDLNAIAGALLAWPGLPIPAVLKAVGLGVLTAYVFREVGKGTNGARSVGFLAVIAAFGLLHGLPGAVMGLGWSIARSDDFKDGSATPTKLKHFLRALVRLIAPAVASVICYFGFDATWAPLGVLVAATAWLGLSAWYGQRNEDAKGEGRPIDPDDNALVERGHGLAAGLAASIALSLSFAS
jgi:hypothetical protein